MAISKGTFVAYTDGGGGGNNVASSSFDSTGNGLLIAVAGWEDVNSSGLAFSDNKGNTWQAAVVEDGGGGAGAHIAVSWCVPTTKGSGHVVTCNIGANGLFRRCGVMPVNGNFSAVDALAATTQQAQATTTGSSPPDSYADAGSLVVTGAPAILIQAVIDYFGGAGAATTGWTLDSATTGRHFQSRIEPSTGTFDPVLELDNVGIQYATIAMAFKETTGGGGGLRRKGSLGLLNVGR